MLSCSVCVFADVGPPNINPYYVYAGPNGTKLTYPTFGIDPERHIIAPAGSKIKITHVNKKLKEYCGFYENDFSLLITLQLYKTEKL